MNEEDQDNLRRYIEEERDRKAVREWYGNIAFFSILLIAVLALAWYVLSHLGAAK